MDFSLDASLALLTRTPRVLDALLRDLPEPWARANEGGDTFSPFDVVGHLIDGEQTDWIVRAEILLEHPEQPFAPYDRFRHRTRNVGRSLPSLLDEFAALRARSLEWIAARKLNESDLDRHGTHPHLGNVTLRQLLATWVVHDQSHLAQIARVLAKQYSTAVGPWAEFLPLLADRKKPAQSFSLVRTDDLGNEFLVVAGLSQEEANRRLLEFEARGHKQNYTMRQELSAAASTPLSLATARPHLRVARPVRDLDASAQQYRAGLGLEEIGRFADHEGFDGVMLGHPADPHHFELTICRRHPVNPSPSDEDLIVLYLPQPGGFAARCAALEAAGFARVKSFNPYWETSARTYADRDGYRFVIESRAWSPRT